MHNCDMSNLVNEESFFDNIKSTLLERFTSPLYIYIISAFCIDNWDKILYVAFGKESIEVRTSIVQMEGVHIWQPIVYGLIMTLAMPFLSRLIEVIHLLSDWFSGVITYFRSEVQLNNICKLKLLEIYNVHLREKKFAENKAILDKIEAESKYSTENLEEKYRLASIRLDSISKQLNEYENIRDGFFRDTQYGINSAQKIVAALDISAKYLDSLLVPSNPHEAVEAHNAIMKAFSEIDIKKIKSFSEQVNRASKKIPEMI